VVGYGLGWDESGQVQVAGSCEHGDFLKQAHDGWISKRYNRTAELHVQVQLVPSHLRCVELLLNDVRHFDDPLTRRWSQSVRPLAFTGVACSGVRTIPCGHSSLCVGIFIAGSKCWEWTGGGGGRCMGQRGEGADLVD
jgi:hypothetical protein